jgi:hypothetical protein
MSETYVKTFKPSRRGPKLRFADETLAERFRDPKNDGEVWLARELGQHVPDNSHVRKLVLQAKRYVMDDDALKLAVDVSESWPRAVLHQLDAIEMPAPSVWIEFSSKTLTAQRLKYGTLEDAPPDRPDTARCGMLIATRDDGMIQTWCIEDGDPDEFGAREGMIVAWPLSYAISLTGPHESQRGRAGWTGLCWGYGSETEDLELLAGRAWPTMDPSFMRLFNEAGAAKLMKELRGWTRLTVSMLALLSTVASIQEVPRPPGQVRLGGLMRPRLKTDRLVIYVPRTIRKPVPWAQKIIRQSAQHKRRLHEVSKHWRHLERMPAAPGWEPVLIGNKWMWRKEIAFHLRGDPALGVVEHRETFVKLNKRYRQITEGKNDGDQGS